MLSTSQFAERLAPIAPRNWSNINDEAQKLVFASWAALLSTSLVGSRARSRVMAIPNLAYASRRKASVRLGSFRFVETSNRGGSVHQQAGSFRFA